MPTYLTPCTDACMLLKHGQSLTIIEANIYFLKNFWVLAADLRSAHLVIISESKVERKRKPKKYLAYIKVVKLLKKYLHTFSVNYLQAR